MAERGQEMNQGMSETFNEMLEPRVEVDGIEREKDPDKISGVVFELYKEACSVVNLSAHILDDTANEKGGWERNQAICAGLLVRICKFMLAVIQLSATPNRMEIVAALNRPILESATNLEFLVRSTDPKYFDQFVVFSLAPERDLYDTILGNIASRGGDVWEIEKRMLDSIDDLCKVSGVRIQDVDRKNRDWGGTLRDRLRAIGKEERYVGIQRVSSHAVHGTWVDLYKNHLEYDDKAGAFKPNPSFDEVDARALAPVGVFVLEATKTYMERFFSNIPETKYILERVDDLRERLLKADAAHEASMKGQ